MAICIEYHKDLIAGDLHVPGYCQATDPGVVGSGKYWIDTSLGAGQWVLKIRNATDTAWETAFTSLSFINLTDTPSSYSEQALKGIRVNTEASGLEFYSIVDTDEKVKYDRDDTTAGYIADKFIAGTGISLAEGIGANENKLVITNSGIITETDPVFSVWLLATPPLYPGGWYDTLQNTIALSGFNDDLSYEVPLTFSTGLTRTINTITCDITQYTDALARASLSSTITGITYTSATGVFSLTTNYVIPTTMEESNWNTAYTWGDHAGLYSLINHTHNLDNLSDVMVSSGLVDGQVLTWDSGDAIWRNKSISETISHTDLSDMPDTLGTNTDHDLRYWTQATDQTLLTGDKSGSFDLTTTGNLAIRSDTGYIDLGATANDYKIQWNGSDAVHTIKAGDFVFTGGSVGIGTTTPSQKLDIVGNINIDGSSAYLYAGHNAIKLATKGDTIAYTSTIIGQLAGDNVTDGTTIRQTAVGYLAGRGNSGANQTALGMYAGRGNTGANQTALGYHAGYGNTGNSQTALGMYAGYSNTGANQTALGMYAGYSNTGANQTALGYHAGYPNTGANQTALGYHAGYGNTGNSQTALGMYAGYGNTGANVTAIGYEATRGNQAHNVVAIGYQAGKDNALANQFIVKQANLNATPLIQGDFVSGNVKLPADNASLVLGAGGDASVYFDGTDLVINPKVVGSGYLNIKGITLVDDKIMFTQTDGNEYIDSLNDGYMDYGATTQHRFNNDVDVDGDVTADSISAVHKAADGTAAVADGTYTMGLGTATNGTITIKGGIITAIQECTDA